MEKKTNTNNSTAPKRETTPNLLEIAARQYTPPPLVGTLNAPLFNDPPGRYEPGKRFY